MTADSSHPEKTTATEQGFQWDIVVFKVEDRIFRVTRHAFIESSVVFESMFLLPPGSASLGAEGKTDDCPIVLEGHTQADFAALLKVLYPKSDDIIAGKLSLIKEEWIGVLKLATVWEMSKIREFAIKTLSDSTSMGLSSVEKVTLARAHKVGRWLVEGLTGLTFGDPPYRPSDLQAAVGLATAYQIVCLQAEYSLLKQFRPCPNQRGIPFSISILHCRHCFGKIFDKSHTCFCGKELILDGPPNVFALDKNATFRGDETRQGLFFTSTICGCLECGKQVMSRAGILCSSCGKDCGNGELFIGPSRKLVEDQVKSVFGDEIASYE